jgi:hypothetical protein
MNFVSLLKIYWLSGLCVNGKYSHFFVELIFCFGEQCNRIINREEQGLLISFDILHICALSREGRRHRSSAYRRRHYSKGFVDRNVSFIMGHAQKIVLILG